MPMKKASPTEFLSRHLVSPDAARTILRAPRSSGGRMAQFTAPPGPDHFHGGSSDPMFPKPLHARPPDHFAVKGEVYHSTISAHVEWRIGNGWFPNGK
jgi:hypothetical protein